MSLAEMPHGVIALIADHVAGHDPLYRRMCDVAVDAAALVLAGCTLLSTCVYEVVEPGCMERAQRDLEKALERYRSALLEEEPSLPEGVDSSSRVDVLREHCRQAGARVSGTKAQLWEGLNCAVRAKHDAWARSLPKGPPSPSTCPLSKDKIEEIQAMRLRRMAGSNAKATYHVTDGDLQTLEFVTARNPHNPSGAPMRLYLVRDVARVALARHGGDHASVKRRKAQAAARRLTLRERRRQAILDGVQDAATAEELASRYERFDDLLKGSKEQGAAVAELDAAGRRLVQLRRALQDRGCELRSDSVLCDRYIVFGEGHVRDIADTMEEMAFLYAHTEYQQLVNNYMDAALDERREYGEWLDREEMSELRHRVSREAREEAAARWLSANDWRQFRLPRAFVGQLRAMWADVAVRALALPARLREELRGEAQAHAAQDQAAMTVFTRERAQPYLQQLERARSWMVGWDGSGFLDLDRMTGHELLKLTEERVAHLRRCGAVMSSAEAEMKKDNLSLERLRKKMADTSPLGADPAEIAAAFLENWRVAYTRAKEVFASFGRKPRAACPICGGTDMNVEKWRHHMKQKHGLQHDQ